MSEPRGVHDDAPFQARHRKARVLQIPEFRHSVVARRYEEPFTAVRNHLDSYNFLTAFNNYSSQVLNYRRLVSFELHLPLIAWP